MAAVQPIQKNRDNESGNATALHEAPASDDDVPATESAAFKLNLDQFPAIEPVVLLDDEDLRGYEDDDDEFDDTIDVPSIDPDNFPGTESPGQVLKGRLKFGVEDCNENVTIDIGRAVRFARYELPVYPVAFKDVMDAIAKITLGGKTVSYTDNTVIRRYNCAVRKTYKQWFEGQEVACPLTRAEMLALRYCHPWGVLLYDAWVRLESMGFWWFGFYPLLISEFFARNEPHSITSRRRKGPDGSISEYEGEAIFKGPEFLLFKRDFPEGAVVSELGGELSKLKRKTNKLKRKAIELDSERNELKRKVTKLDNECKKLECKTAALNSQISALEGKLKRVGQQG
ncbi:hypothetical protein B0T21DRAFT_347843 [Apiosordaria backusii]|uniref:Uncharacterized protein n=1 Tax=Apiosordaria backusii TaxID=314023 RepID=A0AA40BNJ3_9PEZI|nr:hypothetical protein B0T21DRAFT_347843 [Apiosordaria backusii]